MTAITLLSHLDSGMDIALDPLMRGDLTPVFTSGVFWSDFPSWPYHAAHFLAFGPAATMAMVGALLLAAQRRWRWPAAFVALLMLLGGSIPFAVGRIMLHGNTVPEATGAWLLWMLAGPCYAAVLALLVLGVGGWRQARSTRCKAVGYQPAPVS